MLGADGEGEQRGGLLGCGMKVEVTCHFPGVVEFVGGGVVRGEIGVEGVGRVEEGNGTGEGVGHD